MRTQVDKNKNNFKNKKYKLENKIQQSQTSKEEINNRDKRVGMGEREMEKEKKTERQYFIALSKENYKDNMVPIGIHVKYTP